MEKKNLLTGIFVIDGVRQDFTIADLLGLDVPQAPQAARAAQLQAAQPYTARTAQPQAAQPATPAEQPAPADAPIIVDESPEQNLAAPTYDPAKWQKYGKRLQTLPHKRYFDLSQSESSTIKEIQTALISALFCEGNFTLEDLTLDLKWSWNTAPTGNKAALYNSVKSASEFLQDLGVTLGKSQITSSLDETIDFKASVHLPETTNALGDDIYIVNSDIIEDETLPSNDTYLLYVPFEQPEKLNLEGTLFSQIEPGIAGWEEASKLLPDPDYFIDCFEVTRELISDQIAMSAAAVGYGGLYAALTAMCRKSGIELDLNSITQIQNCEIDIVKVLFAEIPGVLLQITEEDLEYVDSQFLLEDIAYYPLGKLNPETTGLQMSSTNAMQTLLANLQNNIYR